MTAYRIRQTEPHSVPVGLTRGICISSTVEGSVFSTSGALMHAKGGNFRLLLLRVTDLIPSQVIELGAAGNI